MIRGGSRRAMPYSVVNGATIYVYNVDVVQDAFRIISDELVSVDAGVMAIDNLVEETRRLYHCLLSDGEAEKQRLEEGRIRIWLEHWEDSHNEETNT